MMSETKEAVVIQTMQEVSMSPGSMLHCNVNHMSVTAPMFCIQSVHKICELF